MEYHDHVSALERTHPESARKVAGFHNLENVLAWMKETGLSLTTIDLVTQDEFCHDLLVPVAGGEYLVFGMT